MNENTTALSKISSKLNHILIELFSQKVLSK